MQWTGPIDTLSGFGVLFDPTRVASGRPADAETLEAGTVDGSLLSWPALGEESMVTVVIDEPMPRRLAAFASEAGRSILRVAGGALFLADPIHLERTDGDGPTPPGVHRLTVEPGRYDASAHLIQWPASDRNAALRREAGTSAAWLRDGLGLASFILGAVTVIGLPVFLVGRTLDDGLPGIADGIASAAPVLLLLWAIVLVGWRLPWVRGVERTDRLLAERFPDVVLHLTRSGD